VTSNLKNLSCIPGVEAEKGAELMDNNWTGISLGDFSGIGPEVTLKALERLLTEDSVQYLLIGDAAHTKKLHADLRISYSIKPFKNYATEERVCIFDHGEISLSSQLDPGSRELADASMNYLKDGAERCLGGELMALVTAPVNKQSIIDAGHDFVGQTEYLSQLAGTSETAMMLLGHDDRKRWLRVVLATTHLPISEVSCALTQQKVFLAIRKADQACRQLGLPRQRVGVCGLNPHAGEGGHLGTEEIKIIQPAVEQACSDGIDVFGPIAADTLFHKALNSDFDVVVAMYHDQGLAPLKMIAFDNGVNWTVGLPFIRTSPDHGTAYEIAGKNLADPSSMIAAIRLAKQLV
jgi:4-hydroxythreonine-4-phosphate dehydrogenase